MDERIITGSSDEPLTFPLVLASDHKTMAVGVTPSLVRISKNGGAFAAPSGAVTERGNGWYQVAGDATDTNTVGPLLLHVEAPACDPLDMRFEIVPTAAPDPLSQGSTTYPLTFLMIASADHIAGKTGLSPTVTIAKVGGSFATPAGAVAEIGLGWYRVGPDPSDYDTSGPVLLHATATGADPTDDRFDITAVAIPGPGPWRDVDAFEGGPDAPREKSIVGLIEALDIFDKVEFAYLPDIDRVTSQDNRVAVVSPLGFRDRPQPSPNSRGRLVGYQVTLKVRAEEGPAGWRMLDQLAAQVSNTLEDPDHKDFGGFCLPWMSRLTGGRYDYRAHPEMRFVIQGQFEHCYWSGPSPAPPRTTPGYPLEPLGLRETD